MRLLETIPLLPSAKGRLYHHSASGEHATKFIGMEEDCNNIAQQCLRTLSGEAIPGYTPSEFFDLLIQHTSDVVIVEHEPPGSDRVEATLGFGVAKSTIQDNYNVRKVIDRLAVLPDFRGNKIAGFILGRMLNNSLVTELIVDTTTFEVENRFLESLHQAGFRHKTEEGSPALWVAGGPLRSINCIEHDEEEVLAGMPSTWTGAINLYGEPGKFDHRTVVYWRGAIIGTIREGEQEPHFDDEIGGVVSSARLFDTEGNLIDTVRNITHLEARLNLLNMYGLVPEEQTGLPVAQ